MNVRKWSLTALTLLLAAMTIVGQLSTVITYAGKIDCSVLEVTFPCRWGYTSNSFKYLKNRCHCAYDGRCGNCLGPFEARCMGVVCQDCKEFNGVIINFVVSQGAACFVAPFILSALVFQTVYALLIAMKYSETDAYYQIPFVGPAAQILVILGRKTFTGKQNEFPYLTWASMVMFDFSNVIANSIAIAASGKLPHEFDDECSINYDILAILSLVLSVFSCIKEPISCCYNKRRKKEETGTQNTQEGAESNVLDEDPSRAICRTFVVGITILWLILAIVAVSLYGVPRVDPPCARLPCNSDRSPYNESTHALCKNIDNFWP